ncbi:MAG: amidohydrolase family protein, partial [Pirellula sp.]
VALTVLPCVELIDVNRNRGDQTELMATQLLKEPIGPAVEKPGLAPHAPYTASMALLQRAAMRAHTEDRLMCMHLAETQEELDWLQDRSGPFASMLEPFMDPAFRARVGTVNSHIQSLSHAWRALVVHGNYLSKHDLISLSRYRDHVGIVYCPRTHATFQHQDHPAGKWNDAIPFMLGTDSRASNPDLSIWEEICWASNVMFSLSPQQIAFMATTGPARFLQVESQAGALRAGCFARLSAVDLSKSRLYPSLGTGSSAVPATSHPAPANPSAMLSDSAIRSISSAELWETMLDNGAIRPLETLPCFQLP